MNGVKAVVIGGGKSVCMARIQQGMSMRALATKAGISVAAISRIERGAIQAVRPLSAQKISSALNVPFETLFAIQTYGANGAGASTITE